MTPAEFEELLKPKKKSGEYTAADGMRFAEGVAGLSEAQRKTLAPLAIKLRKQAKSEAGNFSLFTFSPLPALAVCSISELRKLDLHIGEKNGDGAIKILADRRPDWIDEWIEVQLSRRYPDIEWDVLRRLVLDGLCQKPRSQGYASLLQDAFQKSSLASEEKRAKEIVQGLLAEPDLLEDVWLFFEHDVYNFHDESEGWFTALIKLSEQGALDRQQLLDRTLAALDNDVEPHRLKGYLRLYKLLKTTPEERSARQSRYLELLAHRAPHVVTPILEELAQLDKQKALDGAAFLTAAQPVMGSKTKGQPLTVLKLAASAAKRQPELVPAAIELAFAALTHSEAAVQEKGIELLTAWQPRMHRDHAAEIRRQLGGLNASVRKQVQALLALWDKAPPAKAPPAKAAKAAATNRAEKKGKATLATPQTAKRAAGIDGRWRGLAGLDAARASEQSGEFPPPLTFGILDVPQLTGVEPIAPIQSVDELLDAVARALEIIDSADELERILDALSRLCDQRPADFELRAAPLIQRLERDWRWEGTPGVLQIGSIYSAVELLFYTWLKGKKVSYEPAEGRDNFSERSAFFAQRVDEILKRVVARKSAPLLAAPTHAQGWIDPRTLVARLKELAKRKIPPPVADLIQALLRLAPDRREVALREAKTLADVSGRAVRWALGGSEGPTAKDAAQFPLWLAAGRARNPGGALEELQPVVPKKEAEFALLPPVYSWLPGFPNEPLTLVIGTGKFSITITVDQITRLKNLPAKAVPVTVTVNPHVEFEQKLPLRPTLALYEPFPTQYMPAWIKQLHGAIWPLNANPHHAEGVLTLCERVNAAATVEEPSFVYPARLVPADLPWSELAYLVTWIALVSKDADARSAGVDAFVVAIEDGRADVAQAANVLRRLVPGGWAKLNRVAEACAEVARASPLHAWWMAELLQEFLNDPAELPSDMHHFLALLLELLSDLEQGLNGAARARLQAATIRGKGAAIVKRLLTLTADELSAKSRAALNQAVEARLSRAERWAKGAETQAPPKQISEPA